MTREDEQNPLLPGEFQMLAEMDRLTNPQPKIVELMRAHEAAMMDEILQDTHEYVDSLPEAPSYSAAAR